MKKKLIMLLSFAFIACMSTFIVTYEKNHQIFALTTVEQSVINSGFTNASSIDGCPNEKYECVEAPTASVANSVSTNIDTADIGELPTEYCLRDDYIIYTQNQDRNGLCWNFAATMTATTTIMKATNEYYDLSETWSAIADASLSGTMGGGNIAKYYSNITSKGLMLESDLQYSDSYIISGENLKDFLSFHQQYSNVNLASTLQYAEKISTVEDKKRHIYEKGALWLGLTYGEESFEEKGDNCYYKIPNQVTYIGGGHAVAIIGWDDNFEKEFYLNGSDTPTTFKGAWLILNSWGEGRVKDGISYVFYDDNNAQDIWGFQYVKDTSKELYFYDKIESGYDYKTYVKGKYYGDFVAEESSTKQKNIFYDDVSLEYSYEISNGASIKSIDIYLDNINVTDEFTISIDHSAKKFYISKEMAEYGQHKIIVTYGNNTQTETYLNNFIVTHGLVNYEIEYYPYNNDFGFNEGKELEYFSFSQSKKDYVLYTNKLSGQILFSQTTTPIYSENNIYPYIINYEITEGNSCMSTYTRTANSGYKLNYNFNVEYYEDLTLQNVYVFYDLGGGINHSKNYHKELANETTDLMLYEPTREGYTFAGWYLDYGNGSKKLEEINDLHYIDWEDIHHMGENPSLYAIEHYQSYYNNSNTVFVYAHWEEVEYYNVDITITGNGTVEPDQDILISSEDVVTYNFYPGTGNSLYEVKINGVAVSKQELVDYLESGLTLRNISQDMSIEVTFVKGLLICLKVGENIKNAYLKIDNNGEEIKFYNGDIVPLMYLNDEYMFKFDLIVEVFDDESGYTYVLEELYTYSPISKGVFTQVIWAHINDGIKEIYTGNAIKTQIEEVEINYSVNEYVLDHYLSTDINATSGTQSGSKFNLGEVVYLFVKKPLDTVQYKYDINEYYFEKATDELYRIKIYVHPDNANLYTIYVNRQLQSYKIIFKSWDGTEIYQSYCSYGTKPEYYGEEKYLLRQEDEKYAYEFVGWNPIITQVEGDATYTARFMVTPKEYVISILLVENGIINHPNENNIITYEDIFTYIFVPNEGYKIKDVQVNGVSVGAISNYTFKNVTGDQTISVEFEIQKFTITFDSRGGTLINGTLTQTIEYGANASAPLLTREGYTQDGWDKPLINITADTTITAKWKPITYTITYNLMGGTNHLSNPTNYTIESNSIVLQNPTYEGYNFDGWYYNTNFAGDRIYTINQGSIGNLNLFAKFVEIKCQVIFDLGSSRFGNISCIDGDLDNLEYGDSLTFEVTPDTGYEVDKVFVNDVETTVTVNKFRVLNIQENTSIQVTYKEASSIVTPPNEDSPDAPNDTSALDDTTKYIIYASIGLIVLLLTVLIIIMSKNNKNKKKILAMNDNKDSQYNSQSTYNHSQPEDIYTQSQRPNQTYNSQKVQQVVNNKSNINQQQTPMLQKALEFVKGKEQHFVSFCNRYNIDYHNNYNLAVLRYYKAYLRSIQPPKK